MIDNKGVKSSPQVIPLGNFLVQLPCSISVVIFLVISRKEIANLIFFFTNSWNEKEDWGHFSNYRLVIIIIMNVIILIMIYKIKINNIIIVSKMYYLAGTSLNPLILIMGLSGRCFYYPHSRDNKCEV